MVVKHNIYSFYCIVLSISEQMVILVYITNIYVHVMLIKMIVLCYNYIAQVLKVI